MMELIRTDLANLGVKHDVFFSERTLHGQGGDIDLTLEWLREQGARLPGQAGAAQGPGRRGLGGPRADAVPRQRFGDDVDRALVKSDGSYTYFAADIAYHRNKYLRGFKHMINVLGADHSGYVKRLQAAVKAVSGGEADIDVKIMQLVRLLQERRAVQDEQAVGRPRAARRRGRGGGRRRHALHAALPAERAAMDFDFALVKEQTRDNPVFYVQYAHARTLFGVPARPKREMPALDLSAAALSGGADRTAGQRRPKSS